MKKKNSGKELLQKLGTLMALALLVLIFCVMMPDKFPRISNIMNIFKQASINCLIASGMLCALITAGIDLSVGSNCVLCTCTIGVLVQNFGITSMPLLIIAGLAVSTLAGFVNGILLTRLDLPHPFVSTLGMKNVLTFVYSLSGFMAGMAGVVSVGRLASANGNAGSTYDTDAIAACIIGGASFTGGKGTIWGTLIGALLMAVIRNGLNLMGASNDIQYIVIGAVIILAVTIDVFRNKAEARARKMAAQ